MNFEMLLGFSTCYVMSQAGVQSQWRMYRSKLLLLYWRFYMMSVPSMVGSQIYYAATHVLD
jgi:hypothetical protein